MSKPFDDLFRSSPVATIYKTDEEKTTQEQDDKVSEFKIEDAEKRLTNMLENIYLLNTGISMKPETLRIEADRMWKKYLQAQLSDPVTDSGIIAKSPLSFRDAYWTTFGGYGIEILKLQAIINNFDPDVWIEK